MFLRHKVVHRVGRASGLVGEFLMALEMYRRHNPHKCSSCDTVVCTNKRRGCPIWVSGTKPDGSYVRESLKTRDWKHAEEIKQQWEEQGKKPARPAPLVKLEDFRKRFNLNMATEGKSHETIRKYEQLFKQLEAFAFKKRIQFLTEFDLPLLEEFRSEWPDGDLAKQKKQERLRSVFKYAHNRKLIESNPASELGKIVVKPKQVVPFTDNEMSAILDAAKARNVKAYALILLMRYSGLRISDATMLRLDQLERNRLSLRTQKAHKDVSVLLPEAVAEALRAFVPTSEGYFFWNGTTSLKAVTNLYRDHYLSPVFKAAKLAGNPHPHQFRHTFAIKLLSNGTSVENVAVLLGNTPKIVWKHYAAWVKERQEALDQAVLRANGFLRNMPTASRPARKALRPESAPYKSRTNLLTSQKTSQKPNKRVDFGGGGRSRVRTILQPKFPANREKYREFRYVYAMLYRQMSNKSEVINNK
jgi:site-specific recombinase XerD